MDSQTIFLVNLVTPTLLLDGDTPLYNLSTTKKVLEACRQKGVGILGIDGLYIKDDRVHLTMDFIADFSYAYKKDNFVSESIEEAYRFLLLAEGNSTILFEFVLGPFNDN